MFGKNKSAITLWVLAVMVLAMAGYAASTATASRVATAVVNTIASPQKANDACQPPFDKGYTCTFQPPIVTTSSHTKIVIHKSVTENVKTFEKINHVRVTIDAVPGGVKSLAGCVDPIAMGWIKDGGDFSNTGGRTVWRFTDHWVAGQLACGAHRVKIGKSVFMEFCKSNCKNCGARILLHGPFKFAKFIQVVEFRTVVDFKSTFERWASSTTATTYMCKPPFTLTYVNGQAVCFIAMQIPVTTTPTTTTSQTTTTVHTTTTVTTATTPTTTTTPAPSHFTQINCQFPPHIVANGSQFMYCVATNDNGALISPNMTSNNEALLRASELKSVAVRNQVGDPCPSGAQCFRWTLYAGSGTGFATLTATATSNGVRSDPATGTVEIKPDDTGFKP